MKKPRRAGWILAATLLFVRPARSENVRPEAQLRERLDHATTAFEQGRFEEARREYDAAAKQDPGSIRAWTGLGWSLWQLGKRGEALKIWTDVLKVTPNEPSILLALAQAYEAQEQWGDALGYYDRLIKQNAEVREAYLGRARVLEALGRWGDAELALHEALNRSPGDVAAQFELARVYLKLGRNDEAQRILKQLAARSPEPKYLRLLGDGMLALGRYDEAADYYRRSLATNPDHRGTVLSLSRAYARNHRYREAVDVLKPWVARHPNDDQAREELAKSAESMANFDEAERQLRELMRRHPDDSRWPMLLAKALRHAGKPDQADEVARQVLDRDPKNVDALGLLADDALLAGHEEEAIRLLEQLASVQQIPARLNELGRLRIARGDRMRTEGDDEKAAVEYRAAEQVFEISARLDPAESDAPLGYIAAKRLAGDPQGAVTEAERMLQAHPNLQALRRELYEAYLQLGDWEKADKYLTELQAQYPGNVLLEQQRALLEFNRGDRSQGIDRLQTLLQHPLKRRVPILLYHGIGPSDRIPGALPVASFRDQMLALKRAGYNSITIAQFIDFVDGKGSLPPNPVLITFDDARADTVTNADPLLKELGFHAAMFIPAGEIAQHGPYYAAWRTLQELQASGRWDMECHAYLGHRRVPVDASGHEGLFFTDRQWLADKGRQETPQEFYQRLDGDYRACREVVERQIPGAHVVAYAYPFGDLGQRRLSNEPDAVKINSQLVRKYYRVAFVEDPYGMATPEMASERFPRYEMGITSNGDDLMRLLQTQDPEASTLFLLGNLYAYSGQFAKANELYDEAERAGYDRPTLLTARAQASQWTGDFADARQLFQGAATMRPADPSISRKIANLNRQVAPSLQALGSYYTDNRHRSNFGVGPDGKVFLDDNWALSANYQYREFKQDQFSVSNLPSSAPAATTPTSPVAPGTPSAGSAASPTSASPLRAAQTVEPSPLSTVDLKATGHQFESQLEYQMDWRTGFALGIGVADFQNRSSPRVLENPDTVILASGRASFGIGDVADIAVGGSRGYVPAAGTILENLKYAGGLGQIRLHLPADVTAFMQGGGEAYDDGNRRLSGLFRLTRLVWDVPAIELGYQFVYDDALEPSPFFYTPDRFIANEGVVSLLLLGSDRPMTAAISGAVGEGSERGGNPEVEGSVGGNLGFRLGPHLRFYASGGRTQSARFVSYEASGALSYRF